MSREKAILADHVKRARCDEEESQSSVNMSGLKYNSHLVCRAVKLTSSWHGAVSCGHEVMGSDPSTHDRLLGHDSVLVCLPYVRLHQATSFFGTTSKESKIWRREIALDLNNMDGKGRKHVFASAVSVICSVSYRLLLLNQTDDKRLNMNSHCLVLDPVYLCASSYMTLADSTFLFAL